MQLQATAYGRMFKGIAVTLLALAAAWIVQVHSAQAGATATAAETLFSGLWLPWGLMAYTVWFVLTGQTRLTDTHIEQAWMWPKRMNHHDMAYAKLLRLRGLEWLFAPRFYTKSVSGKLVIFYANDPAMFDAMEHLAANLAQKSGRP